MLKQAVAYLEIPNPKVGMYHRLKMFCLLNHSLYNCKTAKRTQLYGSLNLICFANLMVNLVIYIAIKS